MKSSRAMFSTFALFLTLVVVAECSKLQENHDIVKQFTEAFQRLEEKFAATEAKIDKEMKQIKQENKEVIADLSEAIHRLEAKFAETEVKKDEEKKQMKKENAELSDSLNAEFDEFTKNQAAQQTASAVGFSVYAEEGYQYPELGEIIRFPLVMANNGGHYDTSESVFTCPLNGTYYFTFSLYTGSLSDGKRTTACIQKDGERLSDVYCRNNGPDFLNIQCGNSVVVHSHLGQHVYVTTTYSDTQLHGFNKGSTFSGFLIHADVPAY